MSPATQAAVLFLADRHSLFAFIYGFIRHRQDAEDVLQEVWIRLAKALEAGTTVNDQSAWCRGVARNLVRHYWRARGKQPVFLEDEILDLIELAFAENQCAAPRWDAMREALPVCINRLPPKSQHILQLKYHEALSAEKVGARVELKAEAVLVALSRIRAKLRDCVQLQLRKEGLQP